MNIYFDRNLRTWFNFYNSTKIISLIALFFVLLVIHFIKSLVSFPVLTVQYIFFGSLIKISSWYIRLLLLSVVEILRSVLFSETALLLLHLASVWDEVFKNGLSKICGRQPLINLKSRPYPFKNILKAVFHKFYLAHSWMLCLLYALLILFTLIISC